MSHRFVLRAAAIAAGAILWAGNAWAVTFTGTGAVTATIGTSPAGPDLFISTPGFPPDNQFNVSLNLANSGDSANLAGLFSLSATNLYKTGTDTVSVDFNFTAPPNGATGTLTGTALGHTSMFGGYLEVTWDNPLTLSFDNGVDLQIQLGDLDTTKTCTYSGGHRHCTYVTILDNPQEIYYCSGKVDGVFTYFQHSAGPPPPEATPLPAALPLFAAGAGVFGGVGFWRKRNGKSNGKRKKRT